MTGIRRKLLAGNWKMNMRLAEIEPFFQKFSAAFEIKNSAASPDVLFAAPFTQLTAALGVARSLGYAVAAQNMHEAPSGAFTGEVSALMLTDLGVRSCLIGHSERRQYFGESDDAVAKKAVAAIANGMTPVVCVGETLDQRQANQTFDVTSKQLGAVLQAVKAAGLPASREAWYPGDLTDAIVIAYEPVWAIGTGLSATAEQAQEVHGFLRRICSDMIDQPFASRVRILYGGSANPANIAALLAQPDIDGGLVGGASLKPDDFAAMCQR